MNSKLGMGGVAGVAVIGGLLYLALAPVADIDARNDAASQQKHERTAAERKTKKPRFAEESSPDIEKLDTANSKPRMQMAEDWYAKLPAKDRAIAKRIRDALDADDREAIFKAAEEASSSTYAEVRQSAVMALSLQGEEAMQPLLKFVGDENKDVADAAYWAWDDAVDGVENEFRKLDAVKDVLKVAKSEEHVKTALGKIETMDEALAIRELATLAKEGGKVSKGAKEAYESVTGEPFENWAAAELKAMAIDRNNKAAEGDSDDASDTP